MANFCLTAVTEKELPLPGGSMHHLDFLKLAHEHQLTTKGCDIVFQPGKRVAGAKR